MSASAGRVLLLFKGAYDATVTYYPLDVVKYGVSSYVCIAESTGNIPTNTTYWQILAEGVANVTPEDLGFGGGLSQDSGTARTVAVTGYELVTDGIVAVTFAVDVPANATLNVNSKGAKPIFYRGSAIVANVIRGGDTVTFQYDGTNYKVLCIDGGAGHEIENSAGTKLTQRDVMQVTDGLEAVDDSTGQKTKIGMNLPIVSSADWNAMTEQERTAYISSHYRFGVEIPDTSGVINAEYMKLLWENPNTSQAFAGQTVTLSSADYDFLLTIALISTGGSTTNQFSTITKKGALGLLNYTWSDASSRIRTFTYISDTQIAFSDATINGTTNNVAIIPVAIYGIKKDFQFKVNAIADTLSTRADHCFLDDETTTVEEKLDDIEEVVTANNAGTGIDIKSYIAGNPYTCPSDGYIEVNTANGSGQTGTLVVLGNDSSYLAFLRADYPQVTSLFVRKGMRVYAQNNSANIVETFRPIV